MDFIVETLQDASTGGSECRFQIKIQHRRANEYSTSLTSATAPEPRQLQQQYDPQACTQRQQSRILFVCNFRCFKNTSVANKGEGKWLVTLLQECVRTLPENAIVGLSKPSTEQANQPSELARFPLFMTHSGKVRSLSACNAGGDA